MLPQQGLLWAVMSHHPCVSVSLRSSYFLSLFNYFSSVFSIQYFPPSGVSSFPPVGPFSSLLPLHISKIILYLPILLNFYRHRNCSSTISQSNVPFMSFQLISVSLSPTSAILAVLGKKYILHHIPAIWWNNCIFIMFSALFLFKVHKQSSNKFGMNRKVQPELPFYKKSVKKFPGVLNIKLTWNPHIIMLIYVDMSFNFSSNPHFFKWNTVFLEIASMIVFEWSWNISKVCLKLRQAQEGKQKMSIWKSR